jgi:hypothetical protein
VSISKESRTQWAFQKWMKILLFYPPYQGCLSTDTKLRLLVFIDRHFGFLSLFPLFLLTLILLFVIIFGGAGWEDIFGRFVVVPISLDVVRFHNYIIANLWWVSLILSLIIKRWKAILLSIMKYAHVNGASILKANSFNSYLTIKIHAICIQKLQYK